MKDLEKDEKAEELSKKKRKLKDIEVEFVSFVKRPATRRKFHMFKSRETQTEIFKTHKAFVSFTKGENEAKRILYGVVYAPDEVDAQGDFMDAEVLEKVAHDFLINHRKIDHEHDFMEGAGVVVESYIAPTDYGEGENKVKKGSWVLAVKASVELWDEFNKGNITGFSLAGRIFDSEFIRTPDEEADLNNHGLFWSASPREQTQKTNQEEEVNMDELKKLQEQVDALSKAVDGLKSDGTDELRKSIEAIPNKENIEKTIADAVSEAIAGLQETLQKSYDKKLEKAINDLEGKLKDNDAPADTGDSEEPEVVVRKTEFKVGG